MAKNTVSLKGALKTINKLGRQMNREAMADYDVIASAGAAGTANLLAQTRALSRGLVAGQRQNTLAAQALAAKAAGVSKQVGKAQARAVNKYGSAMGGAIETAFGPAQAQGAAAAAVLSAAAKTAGKQAKVAGVVAGIAAQGVQAQQAAAEYAFAQALQARNMISAETLAGLTGQMYQTAMQYNLQWQMWKRQQDYADKLADKEEVAGIKRMSGEVPGIMDALAREAQALRDEGTLSATTPMDLATAAAEHLGIVDPADPRFQLLTTIAAQVINRGENIGPATTSAINILYADMQPKVRSALTTAMGQYADLYHTFDVAEHPDRELYSSDDTESSSSAPGMHLPGAGLSVNPVTGQPAPPGKVWVQRATPRAPGLQYVLESIY